MNRKSHINGIPNCFGKSFLIQNQVKFIKKIKNLFLMKIIIPEIKFY